MIAAVAASLAIADLAFAETEGPPPHVTDTVVICESPVGVGKVSNCRGRVVDATSPAEKRVTPTGNIVLSAAQGSIVGECRLEQIVKGRSECTFSYVPTELGSGNHQLVAVYPGQVGNETRPELEPSETTSEVEVFAPARTTTEVVCDPDIVSPNIASTCRVTVTDAVLGLATPLRGSISFSTDAQGGFTGAPCSLVKIDDRSAGCEVVYTPTRARVAPHNVTAVYAGDPLRAGSVGVEQVAVSNDPTTLTCSPTEVTVGHSATCTITVEDINDPALLPTGGVTFESDRSGSFNPGGCELSAPPAETRISSCQITYTPSRIGGGTHTITAAYQGDNNHSRNRKSTQLTVFGHQSDTSLTCSPSLVKSGALTTCTATVSDEDDAATTPTGTVTFGHTNQGGFSPQPSCSLSGKGAVVSCSITYAPGAAGTHAVTATYEGDEGHSESFGGTEIKVPTLQEEEAAIHPTATAVVCDPNPVELGESSRCVATVEDISVTPTTPTEDVEFLSSEEGTFNNGTCTLVPAGATEPGKASCGLTYTPAAVGTGVHEIVAGYEGDETHQQSQGVAPLIVNPEQHEATASLICAPNPVESNHLTTCTATVRDIAQADTSAPTGKVSFDTESTGVFSDNGECELIPVQGPGADTTSSCQITYTPSGPAGTHRLRADYPGDIDHSGDSDSFDLAVTEDGGGGGEERNPTTATLACGNPVESNHATVCTATVRDIAQADTSAPTGKVSFGSESTGVFSDEGECELAPLQGPDADSASSCTLLYTPSGPASTHQLEADYPGDTDHAGDVDTFDLAVLADSGPGDQRNPTLASLSCAPNPVESNHATTCTVRIKDIAQAGASAPAGEVSVSSDSTGAFSDEGECELAPVQGPEGADTAACTLTYTPSGPAGTHTLEAEYAGDDDHKGDVDTFDLAVTADGGGGGGDPKHATLATLSCTPNPVESNHLTTCTATMRDIDGAGAIAPTGDVSFATEATGAFSDNGECELVSVQGPDAGTTSSCQLTYTPSGPAGTHALEAEYTGDTGHNGDNDSFDLAVTADNGGGDQRNATLATLSCAPNPVESNHTTACTVEVEDTAEADVSAPTGDVSFRTNSTGAFSDNAECELVPVQGPDAGTTSSCQLTYTPSGPAGTHRLRADYPGDADHVGEGDTFDLAVTADNGGGGGEEKNPTTTDIECLPVNAILGGGTVCTVTVSDVAATDADTPTGSFELQSNGPGDFANTCNLAPAGVAQARCQAIYNPTDPGAAPHVITAAYPGDEGHEVSEDQTAVAVQGPNGGHDTATELDCEPATVILGGVSVCTVKVTDLANNPTPPAGGVVIGSDGAGDFSSGGCLLFAAGKDEARCQLIYEPTLIGAAPHELTAIYGGNPGHEPSQSTSLVEVTPRNGGHRTETALDCPANAIVGTAVTCTATVTDTDPGVPTAPTRAVIFASDSAGVFGVGGCQLGQPAGNQASCRFTYTPLAVGAGNHRLFAAYEGDATHEPSQLTSDEVTVTAPAQPPVQDPPKQDPPKQDPPKVTPPTAPTAPNTILRKKPRKKTAKAKAKFKFIADQPGSVFQCKLDKKPFKPCRAPFKKKVKPGRHVFKVRAINPQGLTDPTPAVFKWRMGKVKKTR